MATERQIDSAALERRAPIGADAMARDAILAMPAAEREKAIAELQRARRCVLRTAGDHAGDMLDALGLAAIPALEALERERVRDFDALADEAWPARRSKAS